MRATLTQTSRGQQPTRTGAAASGRGTVVIIGGGFGGTLATWALRGVADRIVVVERDHYPTQSDFRPGVPQARHAHLLLESGHRLLEGMMPGIRDELLAAGAVKVAMSRELRWLTSAGWMADYDSDLSFLSCTRPLLDHVVRSRLHAESTMRVVDGREVRSLDGTEVTFLEAAEVVGLLGSPRAVTGVRIRRRGSLEEMVEHAELVVDASGRTSRISDWLDELGCAPIPEECVDPGIVYISRLYRRRPDDDLGFRALYLQTSATNPRTGSMLPVEGDRWLVSLGGMRGYEPQRGDDGFEKMLEQLRDPTLREALRTTEPVSTARIFRPGPGIRRHLERGTPDGLIGFADAAASFDPVWGQGMSVAVRGAQELRAAVLRHGGIGHATARAARKAITASQADAWLMSSSEDARFPATKGGPSAALTSLLHPFINRVLDRATTNVRVTHAFHEVMSLVAPPTTLLRPRILASILIGRR
ncbi:FAD-binding monooxygenase [Nocardia abscessus]|uniref:FAD-binding monooxygenase n=1 Tax=Nocardia abscessus TaxID=120957 RepID=A0ABS0CG14_9NOCA|nr:FAD-binding protein [Nocardia abscessus]MBF6229279.1 FAD-binding monooxygenase [Nocardia abscessus]